MSDCIKCGKDAGPLSPEMRAAKVRMGMPLTPPKVCPECLWSTLLTLDDEAAPEPSAATDTPSESVEQGSK